MENISKILKDCPTGTKLYSPICGECELQRVVGVDIDCTIVVKSCKNNGDYVFYGDGSYCYGIDECLLFPSKENRDWGTFKPELKFKKGDFVVMTILNYKLANKEEINQTIFIFKEGFRGAFVDIVRGSAFCGLFPDNTFFNEVWLWECCEKQLNVATEKQKQKLLDAIDKNGYIWDDKKLEFRKKSKFKVGDRVMSNAGGAIFEIVSIDDYGYNGTDLCDKTNGIYIGYTAEDEYHLFTPKFKVGDKVVSVYGGMVLEIVNTDNDSYICTRTSKQTYEVYIKYSEEDKYKLFVPKFKVGDKICYKLGQRVIEIKKIKNDSYLTKNGGDIRFEDENLYYLVKPSEFKPFDKVLVKYENNPEEIWECDIFSCYCPEQDKDYPFHCIGGRYDICIPYEGNEHLIGTTKAQAD